MRYRAGASSRGRKLYARWVVVGEDDEGVSSPDKTHDVD